MRSSTVVISVAVGTVIGLALPTAAAQAGHLINGATIKPHTIAGNRMKPNTVTGAQVDESTLGVVPKATTASSAAVASSLTPLVWRPLALHNIWAAYGHGYDAAAYAIDAQKIVHLRGAIQGSPSGSVAFSFPKSVLSPDVNAQYAVAAHGGNLALLTVTDGSFCPLDGAAPASSVASFTDLDGVTFAES